MGQLRDFFRKKEEKEIRYILSIDGGGMRGIIPARILMKLDDELKAIGDSRPLYSHFDLIAGTSTGALLSLALSCPQEGTPLRKEEGEPVPVKETVKTGFFRKSEITRGFITPEIDPQELSDIYLRNGKRIFPRVQKGIFGQIFVEKYDARPLENFLLGVFSDKEFSDLKVPTAIVSFNTLTSDPYVFRSWDSHGFLIREVARSTTAAPTYFTPSNLIDRKTGEHLTLIDGGMCANNPIVLAYGEAKKLYPNADEFRILSLSTCKDPYVFDASKVGGGLTGWLTSITKVYQSAQDRMMDLTADIFRDAKVTRITSHVLEKRLPLDDTSETAINTLLQGGETAWSEHEAEIKSYAEELAGAKTGDRVELTTPDLLTAPEPKEELEAPSSEE